MGVPLDRVAETHGCTSLGIAGYFGHLNIVKYLQYKGASLTKSDSKGENTPLLMCCKAGQIEIVEYLLNFDEVMKSKNIYEYSPMIYAISSKNERLVSIFLKAKYDTQIKNKNNESILFHALRTSSSNIIKLLYSTYKMLDNENNDGITAFMFAFLEHNFEVVDIMRNFGAEVTQKNSKGEKISDIAKRKGDKQIIDYLKNFNLYEPNIDYKIISDTIETADLHTLNNNEYDINEFDLRKLSESQLMAPKEPELLLADNENKTVSNQDSTLPPIMPLSKIHGQSPNNPSENFKNIPTDQVEMKEIKSTISTVQFNGLNESNAKYIFKQNRKGNNFTRIS